jgi:hypothetical protein
MQGSHDAPSIIIRSSRAKIGTDVADRGGVCCDRRIPAPRPQAKRCLITTFFGAAIPIFAWRLIRPDILTLAPDGASWRSTFGTACWQWADLQDFRPYKPTSKTMSKHIGFDFTDSYRARYGGPCGLGKAMTGVEGSLGTGWELSAAELAELVNQARARWATDRR